MRGGVRLRHRRRQPRPGLDHVDPARPGPRHGGRLRGWSRGHRARRRRGGADRRARGRGHRAGSGSARSPAARAISTWRGPCWTARWHPSSRGGPGSTSARPTRRRSASGAASPSRTAIWWPRRSGTRRRWRGIDRIATDADQPPHRRRSPRASRRWRPPGANTYAPPSCSAARTPCRDCPTRGAWRSNGPRPRPWTPSGREAFDEAYDRGRRTSREEILASLP